MITMYFLRKLFGRKANVRKNSEAAPHPFLIIHLEQASLSFQRSDWPSALYHCEQAIRLDPTNTDAYRLRGVVKFEMQDLVGASEDLHASLLLKQS